MITLIEAFKILGIKNEMVYFRYYKDNDYKGRFKNCFFWSEDVRNFFDMKKIHVIKIEKHFTFSEDSEKDYEFLINLSFDEIRKAKNKTIEKNYNNIF